MAFVISASSALAGGKVQTAIQEHQNARRQLKETHQELFDKMDRYFEALSSKTRDPAKVAIAKQEIDQTNQKIEGILKDAGSRMNTLISSMKYSMEYGLREKTNEDELRGKPIRTSEVANVVAQLSSGKKDGEDRSRMAPVVGSDPGFPNSGRRGPRPSPTASAPEVNAPEIKDQQGPREFVFGKRKATEKSSPAKEPVGPAATSTSGGIPTPDSTPTARAD